MILRGGGQHDAQPRGAGERHAADDQAVVRAGELPAGGRGEVDVEDVAPTGVIGPLAQSASFPTGAPQSISPPTISGVTPLSNSASVHRVRRRVRRIVMWSAS